MSFLTHPTAALTPDLAFERLKAGNERFVKGKNIHYNLLQQVQETKDDPRPFAAVLGCMDSRAPAELIFDQGIGAIFNIRIAGNVVSPHILGSLEYAVTAAGIKLIVVMGHTNCGAIKSACNNLFIEHLYGLLQEVKTCIAREYTESCDRTGSNSAFVDKIALINVYHSVEQLTAQSSIIRQSAASDEIKIIPAMYHVATGTVTFKTGPEAI